MKKIVKLTFVLFLVSAVMAGVLGVVNNFTAPIIEIRQQEKTMKSYAAVLEAPGYNEITDSFPELDKTITKVSETSDGTGYVFETYFSGAQGMITMVVGVGSDFTCTGISITAHSETSGLGAVAASSGQDGIDYRAQYVGVDANAALTKKGGTIEAITGATITSDVITQMVATCIATVQAMG